MAPTQTSAEAIPLPRQSGQGVSARFAINVLSSALQVTQAAPSLPSSQWVAPTSEEMDLLFLQYDIIRSIARGGMGAVYKAYTEEGEIVAIKVLPQELSAKDRFIDRFQREVRNLASMDHPNIVALKSSGTAGEGLHYFVMEYIEGTSLRMEIEKVRIAREAGKDSPYSLESVLSVAIQICSALEYAHQKGILHRDIKPSNILLQSDNVVKVVDFGLSRPIEPDERMSLLTETGQIMGTREYSAPELLEHKPFDHRVDIYALGVVLYEMCMGKLPRGNFSELAGILPWGREMDRVILKAIEPDPAHRFQSAAEMKQALEMILRRSRRSRWRKPLLISAAVLVGGGVAIAAWPAQTLIQQARAAPASPPPPAGLYFYEPFDLPPGVEALAGKRGFSASPLKARNADILSNSLQYTDSAGNKLVTMGNSALLDGTKSSNSVSQLAPIDLTRVVGNTLWISFVGQQTAGTGGRFFNVSLRAPKNTIEQNSNHGADDEVAIFGRQSNQPDMFWQLWDRGTDQPLSSEKTSPVPSTELSFILGRVIVNVDGTKNERCSMWVNPRLDVDPVEAEGMHFNSMASNFESFAQINRVRIGAGAVQKQSPGTAFAVDEIRVSERREDVCPYVK